MGSRNFKFSWKEIELLEAALQHQIKSIERVDRTETFTPETRKVILKERKEIEDLLYAIKEGERDV